jgi:hypothetical protein
MPTSSRDDLLRQRGLSSLGMRCIDPNCLAVLTHRPRPDLLACDALRQAHDFTTPGRAIVARIFAALEQELVHHFMQQRVVVGEKYFVILGDIERNGSAARIWIVGAKGQPFAKAKGQPFAKWQRVGENQWDWSERVVV